jgi:archaellum component FlaC
MDSGVNNRKGGRITYAVVRHMLQNQLYTGYMVCGDVSSEFIPELQIVDDELFQQAQQIREQRADKVKTSTKNKTPNAIPTNIKGSALISGNAFCAACGGKLYLSLGGHNYTRKSDGVMVNYRRQRYTCNNKTRKLKDCDGQTSYAVDKLDSLISEFLLGLFQNIKGAVEGELVDKSYQSELKSLKVKLKGANAELHKHTESLKTLQGEVIKAIQGESKFDSAVLNDLIAQTKDKIQSSSEKADRYQSELENRNQYLTDIQADYKKLVSWAEIFQDSTPETKKMITAYLIKSVKVSRGYKMDITFNVAFEQFFNAV